MEISLNNSRIEFKTTREELYQKFQFNFPSDVNDNKKMEFLINFLMEKAIDHFKLDPLEWNGASFAVNANETSSDIVMVATNAFNTPQELFQQLMAEKQMNDPAINDILRQMGCNIPEENTKSVADILNDCIDKQVDKNEKVSNDPILDITSKNIDDIINLAYSMSCETCKSILYKVDDTYHAIIFANPERVNGYKYIAGEFNMPLKVMTRIEYAYITEHGNVILADNAMTQLSQV